MTSQPTLSHADAASSLLSLSLAAAVSSSVPSQIHSESTPVGSGGASNNVPNHQVSSSLGTGPRQHRRLASTGKTRRRLSDARDAANRPSPALLQSAALSLSTLSLSSSPPSNGQQLSTSFTSASNALNAVPGSNMGLPASAPLSDGGSSFPSNAESTDDSQVLESTPIPINGKGGKKRGVDHKCESCSKIYRHPSCLIKHRWEHTPHWREASKFVLSKHQQVQLLEAAAILSHLSPKNSSLPEDRSLWPSFLSGGSLPKSDSTTATSPDGTTHSVSSSVPNNGNFHRTPSNGPRLHDYSIPTSSTGAGGITQLRPGLVGVPTGPNGGDTTAATAGGGGTTTKPVPVPQVNTTSHPSFRAYRSSTADSWSSSQFDGGNTPSSFIGSAPFPFAPSGSNSASALSNSSQSRSPSGSASGSRSDDESLADIDIDIEVEAEAEAADTDLDGVGGGGGGRGGYSSTFAGRYGYGVKGRKVPIWKKEEEEMTIGFIPREEDEIAASKQAEWDGMEMEMDMD